MKILEIQHKVGSYEEWKKLFDSDPIDRKGSGVIRYNILRQSDDSNSIVVHLEFDDSDKAETALNKLRKLWAGMTGNVISGVSGRILNSVEAKDY